MTRYRFPAEEADKIAKHGIDLTLYGYDGDVAPATVVHVDVKKGHFQEFSNVESAYIYYVVAGRGTFYLDGEAVAARPGDLVVAPPNTRIYYFGTMRLVLTVSPAFDEKNERHIRFIDEKEGQHLRH